MTSNPNPSPPPSTPKASYSNSSATQLVRTTPDLLETRTSTGGQIISLVFIVVGIGGIALAAWLSWAKPTISAFPVFHRIFGWVFACLFYPVFALFALVGWLTLGGQRMQFDGRNRVLRLKRTVAGLGREVPFTRIDAVEIVPGDHGKREGQATIVGSIDLVFVEPAGSRIGVAMRYAEDRLQADAKLLSEFTGAPVRDTRPTPDR